MGDSNASDDKVRADLGGIETVIPASISKMLSHIAKFHSGDLELLTNQRMDQLERSLQGTRLGDGLCTIMAILQLTEDHMGTRDLLSIDVEEARRDLYDFAFQLLGSLVTESGRSPGTTQ